MKNENKILGLEPKEELTNHEVAVRQPQELKSELTILTFAKDLRDVASAVYGYDKR
jgi:hypothetical protein